MITIFEEYEMGDLKIDLLVEAIIDFFNSVTTMKFSINKPRNIEETFDVVKIGNTKLGYFVAIHRMIDKLRFKIYFLSNPEFNIYIPDFKEFLMNVLNKHTNRDTAINLDYSYQFPIDIIPDVIKDLNIDEYETFKEIKKYNL